MQIKSFEELAVRAQFRPGRLAGLCNVSLRTLQRHFASQFGLTLSQWLKDLRMGLAYGRIKGGETVKCVAYDLGFKQLSHFSRVFKQVHGVAPSYLCGRRRCLGGISLNDAAPGFHFPSTGGQRVFPASN